jgi:hypothetical protein
MPCIIEIGNGNGNGNENENGNGFGINRNRNRVYSYEEACAILENKNNVERIAENDLICEQLEMTNEEREYLNKVKNIRHKIKLAESNAIDGNISEDTRIQLENEYRTILTDNGTRNHVFTIVSDNGEFHFIAVPSIITEAKITATALGYQFSDNFTPIGELDFWFLVVSSHLFPFNDFLNMEVSIPFCNQ